MRRVDLRVIWVILRPSRDQSGRCHSGSILGRFWVNSGAISRPILGNLINLVYLRFIGLWVGLKPQSMLNMGPGTRVGGYRYSTLPAHPPVHHPGYTSPCTCTLPLHRPYGQTLSIMPWGSYPSREGSYGSISQT